MPFESLHKHTGVTWALWKISEEEETLADLVSDYETVPETLTNPLKRLEFLAGRALIKELAMQCGLNFKGIVKDEFGKPFLNGHSVQISLSHSYPYVAACISSGRYAGIDIEQPKEKLFRVAGRIMAEQEFIDAGNDLTKHCIYWCAKETLVKVHGKKDLIFSKNLIITPFTKGKCGELIGSIIVNNEVTDIPLLYFVEEAFVVVVNK